MSKKPEAAKVLPPPVSVVAKAVRAIRPPKEKPVVTPVIAPVVTPVVTPVDVKPTPKPVERERTGEAARRFKALGEPTRLRIVLFLRDQGNTPDTTELSRGVRVTEICQQVTGKDKLTSTFSHHLKELRRAGLVQVEKDGKNRWCRLEQVAFDKLLPFLTARLAAESETGDAA